MSSNGVNWTKVLSKCSGGVRKTILETRALHEELRRQIVEAQQTTPKLDFAVYRARLPKSMAAMVADAEGQLKAFRPPTVDVSPALEQLDKEQQVKMKDSRDFIATLDKDVGLLRAKLTRIEAAKPVDELTVEDVYEVKPELREQFYQKIRDDDWSVTESAKADEAKTLAGEMKTSAGEASRVKSLDYL